MRLLLACLLVTACCYATEYRRQIAVLDTGITVNKQTQPYLCEKQFDLTQTSIEDTILHGTNIAGIIVKKLNPKTSCILVIKYYQNDSKGNTQLDREVQGLRIALDHKVYAVNFSSGGPGFSFKERYAIQQLLNSGIYVIVAAGNNGENLRKNSCNYYPACYNFKSKYFKVVGNGQSSSSINFLSNYGEVVTDWRDGRRVEGFGIHMSGSSQSTAILTGEIVGDK